MPLRAGGSFLIPASPWPLALLRIAVCGIILISPEPQRAMQIAARPPELWLAPPGLAWFVPIFSWFGPHLWLIERMLCASALLGLVGLWTRLSLSVLALTFVIAFGGAQLGGAVLHDMHLLWFVLLLMVSPSAQVMSLDAWANDNAFGAADSTAAALATFFVRLLLGMIYFFPGLHKLLDSGIEWASSNSLQQQLWLKWFQAGGVVPEPRVDQWPHLLVVGGAGVLIFELGFIFCLAWRRGRIAAAVAGLTFHALTRHFMYIPFVSLWGCYVILWNGPSRSGAQAQGEPNHAKEAALERLGTKLWPLAVGAVLTLAAALQGLRGETQSWPFACYPTFSRPPPSTLADLAIELQSNAGETRLMRVGPLPPSSARARSPADWSTVWRLAGLYGDPISPPALLAFARELARRQVAEHLLRSPGKLRVFVEHYATAPEAYGNPPVRRALIHEELL